MVDHSLKMKITVIFKQVDTSHYITIINTVKTIIVYLNIHVRMAVGVITCFTN